MECEALVLDFDGLLVDTERAAKLAWQNLFAEYGIVFPDRGLSRADATIDIAAAARALMGAAPVPLRFADVMDAYEALNLRGARREPLAPGVPEFLDMARALRVPLLIASANDRDWVEGHLSARGILHWFDAVICAGPGTRPKPWPDAYRQAVAELGVPAHRVIAFEDSFDGLRAAHAAAMPVVLVSGRPLSGRAPGPLAARVRSFRQLTLRAPAG